MHICTIIYKRVYHIMFFNVVKHRIIRFHCLFIPSITNLNSTIVLPAEFLCFLFCKSKIWSELFGINHSVFSAIIQCRFIFYLLNRKYSCYISKREEFLWFFTFKKWMQKKKIFMYKIRFIWKVPDYTIPFIYDDYKCCPGFLINLTEYLCKRIVYIHYIRI